MKTSFTFYDPASTINRLCRNDQLGVFVASTVARYADQYVPMDTGALAQNYTAEPFEIHYTQPYANKVFNGTHIRFRTDKHPLAQARWDRAVQSSHVNQIASEISQYIASR